MSMSKGALLLVGVAVFFAGAFVNRTFGARHEREAAMLLDANTRLAQEREVLLLDLHKAKSFISELQAPLRVRAMLTPLSEEEVEATKVTLDANVGAYLIYRVVPTPPEAGNFETAAPEGMLKREDGNLNFYANFKSRTQPGKEVRLRMQPERR